MKTRNLFFCLLLIGIGFAGSSYAVEIFEVISTDLSKQYLGTLFGNQVGSVYLGGQPNPVLQDMFAKFNAIVLSVGVAIISYISVISTLNTAQDGEMMGKKWSSVWLPMRSILGMLLIIPSPASGYSLIQSLVIWIILQGVGAANNIWDIIMDGYAKGVGAASVTGYGHIIDDVKQRQPLKKLSKNLLRTAICMEGLKHIYSKRNDTNFYTAGVEPSNFILTTPLNIASYKNPRNRDIRADPSNTKLAVLETIWSFGVRNAEDPSLRNLCGSYKITTSINEDIDDPQDTGRLEPSSEALRVMSFKEQGLSNMLSLITPIARSIVREKSKDGRACRHQDCLYMNRAGALEASQLAYAQMVSQLTKPLKNNDRQETSADAKAHGWIHAGSYYRKLTSMDTGLTPYNTVTEHIPTALGVGPTLGNLNNGAFAGMNETPERTSLTNYFLMGRYFEDHGTPKGATSIQVGEGTNVDSSELFMFFSAFITGTKSDFKELLTGKNSEPMASIASFGGTLMRSAETAWITVTVIATSLAGAFSACPAINPGFAVWFTMAFTLFTMIAGVMLMLWGIGATLGIYLPMIPYMIFTTTAIGWIVMVIEAVISAPILAIGFMMPGNGNDELGKITPGLMILANIFLRPTLMLFSFVLSIRLFSIIVMVINFGFFETVGENTNVGDSPFGFGTIFAMVLYASFIIAAANQCFTIIYRFPDKIMQVIGGSPVDSGAQQVMSETKGMADQGSQNISAAQKGMSEAAQKKATDELKEASKRGQENSQKAASSGGGGGGGG